jgi:hypothetical protein
VNASGLIASAAVNEARFDHNPATGESLGLLVEEARTNLVTYSENLTDASWLKGSSTLTGDAITAPDGTITADKLVENTQTSTSHVVSKNATTTAATHTFSVYLKKAERSFAMLYDLTNAVGAYFNLDTGVISTGGSGIRRLCVFFSKCWQRLVEVFDNYNCNLWHQYLPSVLASSSTVYS